jgi:hypothetical protein
MGRGKESLGRSQVGYKRWYPDGMSPLPVLLEVADGSYQCLSRVRNQYPLRHPDQHQIHRLYMSHKISNLIKRIHLQASLIWFLNVHKSYVVY